MNGMRWWIHAIAGIILVLTGPAMSQPPAPGNLHILQQLIIAPLVQTIQHSVPPRETVYLSVSGERELAEWVQETAIPLLLAKKIRVYKINNDNVNYRIMVTGITARIMYRPLARNWLTQVVQWQRTITVGGKMEVLTTAGEVKGIYPLTSSFSDTLAVNPRTLETPEYPFTKGNTTDATRWKKWVEPILISAATITVVALFFTIRSQRR